MRVREVAAAAVEERQREWAYSRPVVALDVAWNLAFLVIGVAVLCVSNKEEPCVPLRVWIVGYLLQGASHSLCVVAEFRRRRTLLLEGSSSSVLDHNNRVWDSFSSGSDYDDLAADQFLEGEENRYTSFIFNLLLLFFLYIFGVLLLLILVYSYY